jgi:YVTN family beta-propeller protein
MGYIWVTNSESLLTIHNSNCPKSSSKCPNNPITSIPESENNKLVKKASIEQGIHNRHQKTTKTVRVAGIIAAILLLSCVLALLPQSAQAWTLTDTITVGNGVGGIAVTPNGQYVYSTNRFDGTVSVISTLSNTVIDTITVGGNPIGVAIAPNGEYAYVANYGDSTVSVIATATNTVTATITGFTSPEGVAIAPNGELVYITNYFGNSISVISTATNTVTATITGLNYPEDVAVAPDGGSIYVKTNYDGVSVSVISTSTNTVTATINLAGDDPYFENGVGGIAVAPNGECIYVTYNDWSLGNSVSVISTSTNTVTATINLGGWSGPEEGGSGVAVAPNGEYLYATNNDWMSGGGYLLSVISTRTNTVIENVSLGEMGDPFGGAGCVAVTPNGEYIYAANGGWDSNSSQ